MGQEASHVHRGRPRQTIQSDLVLMVEIARRYYLHEQSKVEIANEYHLSRFQVARLLDNARTSGLVRIEISYPTLLADELAERVQEAFGLRSVVVLDCLGRDADVVRHCMGQGTANLLGGTLAPGDTLGLGWTPLNDVILRNLAISPTIPIVQLAGDVSDPDIGDTSNGISISAFGKFVQVTAAVVGIGLFRKGGSALYDTLRQPDREELQRRGAFAELSGILISAEGKPITGGINERMIRIDPDRLRAVREVIGIAHGAEKAPAVYAAVKSGLVNSLVLDTHLAEALLATASSVT